MSKLFNLKEWLTVPDAARNLSIVCGEEVTEADVLRLALDGHLKLSVNFVNHTQADCGEVVGYEDTTWEVLPTDLAGILQNIPDEAKSKPITYMTSLNIDDSRFLNRSHQVTTINGVWDLPMIGGERATVENEYQRLTGGPNITLATIEGAFVEGRDGKTMCQLQERFNIDEYQSSSNNTLKMLKQHIVGAISDESDDDTCNKEKMAKIQDYRKSRNRLSRPFPRARLPEDSILVVRTDALRDFESAINEEPTKADKPLSTTERNSLLVMIAALCKKAGIDHQKRGSAPMIVKMADEIGVPLDAGTVLTALKQIPDAVGARQR